MGNKILCQCNRALTNGNEVVFKRDNDNGSCAVHDNITFGNEHVKSINKIQNSFRRSMVFEKLQEKVRLIIEENQNNLKFQLVTKEEFNEKIKEVINQILAKVEPLVIQKQTSKNKMVVKMKPMKNNQVYYLGEWNTKGEKEGLGKMINEDQSVYFGFFLNDHFNGFGALINTTGDYYLGNWANSQMTGNGILNLLHARIKYEGSWVNNVKEGEGEEVYQDGSIYKGTFLNNQKEGQGVYIWHDKTVYKGYFSNSMMNGYGEMKWPDGRVYKGNFLNNKLDGKGVHIWSNGYSYEGDYKNDLKFGEGIFIWSKDKYYQGQWMNNKQHGYGTVFVKGKAYRGQWRFGKVIRLTEVSGNENNVEKTETQYYSCHETLTNNVVNSVPALPSSTKKFE